MLMNENIASQRDKAQLLVENTLTIPEGYGLVSCLLFSHDQVPVFVFRYQKTYEEKCCLGGEHFSVSVDLDASKIMGFMHIEQQHCGAGLPSEEEAKATAVEFIPKVAPDLVGKYEVKWIMPQLEKPNKIPHESPFPFTDLHGRNQLVTGVRVKLFFEHLGTWGWVIVGRNQQIISFEREVIWNTTLNRRSTPAWLHDPYVKELKQDLASLN
ncbi:hypothetical protein ACMZOO_15640 [Catenovulum sp. SX2]|uniref:hypothetical protein n=1 Tax=Catenovulum sp. SX2 TaxID=3398614 RepID=UPI003F86B4AE